MKFILLISTAIYTAIVLAAPGTISLNRSFKAIAARDGDDAVHIACIECPCDGFSGSCKCVNNGCCCDMTNPGMPPAGGWKQ
ncbi:hypothetical protein P3342_006660 [Pyrenophora teres f. teres]|uniref:Uncharacterized protein n=2 Tax=Pyrenophora teres f. teres TaxID=97479 RepID=E3RXK0_PYRTT|nr:hypothetical protein PTT_14129 [Pyrenophora teres f. teres 0-1]KAE8833404.1 hypothetical protein HRS9139_05223 [Pyrenophora teres f. teres]CAA9961083.1 hypothetical protein PTMSG1_04467 [Pyrenophora teres f. maculata]KAE8840827.1 hypothetical protein PTNB85_04226 [Pyrenophora teres f. teres]KAE8849035.1 hypothetical protein HRS9122_03051 [Pyrenophora teres f. teres]